MATIIDYVDRTVDVAAFQGWELGVGVEALLDQQLASPENSGEVLTGVVKLVQRFLLLLFTEIGSLTYLPDSGCTFMRDARQGRWRSSADVSNSFHFAIMDVRRQTRRRCGSC